MKLTPALAALAVAGTVLLLQPGHTTPRPASSIAAAADAPDVTEHGAPQPEDTGTPSPDPTDAPTPDATPEPDSTTMPTPDGMPTPGSVAIVAPDPDGGCLIVAPWDGGMRYQLDSNCDGTADACQDVPHAAYAEAVARGYGSSNDYCVTSGPAYLAPPMPPCFTQDADGWDDYNCDGRPDYFRVPA